MAFDPTKPVAGAEIDANELRDQLNGLNDLITDQPSMDEVNNAIVSNTPRNCDNVGLFTGNFSNPPTQAELVAFKTWANGLVTQLHRL